jgi:hypothetical protein
MIQGEACLSGKDMGLPCDYMAQGLRWYARFMGYRFLTGFFLALSHARLWLKKWDFLEGLARNHLQFMRMF